MSARSNQPHAVRRVVLPSGKTIEVVYFADGGAERAEAAPQSTAQLHICPQCTSDLVYPTDWEEAGEARWELKLRCPNCEWRSEGSYDQATVERLDEELDRGTHAVLTDLKQLARASMEADIARFTEALDADHIWPIDF